MNKADRRLLIVLLFVSLAGLAVYYGCESAGDTVVIKVDGRLYGSYNLNVNRSIRISTSGGTNEIVIEDKKVYMKEADCPDRLCVKHGKLLGAQDSIVCLPHKVVVTLKEGNAGEGGIDATAQ